MSPLASGLIGLAAAAFLWVGDAAAHDVWLQSSRQEEPGKMITVDQRVDVRLLVGHGDADPKPVGRNEGLLDEFTAFGPDGVQQPLPGVHGMDPAGVFRPGRPGLWSLVYLSRPTAQRLAGDAFESYLAEEGLDWVSARRSNAGRSDAPGRELYSRSLEELVPVCGVAATAGVATAGVSNSVTGGARETGTVLPVRFHLTLDHRSVRLRLMADGVPVAGALVDLRRDGRLVTSARTDRNGSLRLRPTAGSWVASAVVMEESDDPHAEWRTVFGALTFPWPLSACP